MSTDVQCAMERQASLKQRADTEIDIKDDLLKKQGYLYLVQEEKILLIQILNISHLFIGLP